MLRFVGAAFGAPALAMIRGVPPDLQGQYEKAPFHCDGAREVLPSSLNDDFCDCTDGSDEPGTGACAGAAEALFHCANPGSAPRLVYVSRVGDGICDCCDGSDEERRICPDTCQEEGARLRAEKERKLRDLRAGLQVKQATILEEQKQVVAKQEELDRLVSKLPNLETQLAEARKRKEEADAAKSQQECQSDLPKLREKVKLLEAKIASLEAQLSKDEGTTTSTTTKVVSEYAKWMEGADDAMGEEAEADREAEEMQEPEPQEAHEASAGTSGEEQVDQDSSFSPISGAMLTPKELKALEEQVKTDQASRDRLERWLRELPQDKFGFATLRDKCLEHKTSEYTYKLCFFKDAKQSFTRLGTWSGFEGPLQAVFKDGDMCYGGPARSLRVIFECGAEEEVVDVSEPSRCSYQALVRHAGACEEHTEEPRLRHPKEEL
ncbi:PRKCSH [Symbiodinium pilosum]|uniref:Glucosidase 2 subunit beta n=1 Tax=Symbiodinium pilosum TaxID=2952 RepID=A0A812KYL3_SYMPI|nr:PRKCSH [Symbiodinium pilosum]